MEDTIKEFIREQELKPNTEIKITKQNGVTLYTNTEKIIENFYKFLKKKSYVKNV